MKAVNCLFRTLKIFRNLSVNPQSGPYVHKPCHFLAVIDAIEFGLIRENKIRYEPYLLLLFDYYFDIVRETGNAHYSFVNLVTDKFQNLKSKLPLNTGDARRTQSVVIEWHHWRLNTLRCTKTNSFIYIIQ